MARGADTLQASHLRCQTRQAHGGALHCFVLDCSASMLADGHLAEAKGVLLALMEEAYRRRDQVALLCFGGNGVALRLPPRRAALWNDDWIAPIGGGGGTPLAQAVAEADALLARHAASQRWLWLLSDGRTRESPARPASADRAVVIDFESARAPLRRAAALAARWGADYRAGPYGVGTFTNTGFE